MSRYQKLSELKISAIPTEIRYQLLLIKTHCNQEIEKNILVLKVYFRRFYFYLFFFIFCSIPFTFIRWRLITLQYCSGFCHTLT